MTNRNSTCDGKIILEKEAVAAAARAVPVRALGVAVYNPAFDGDGRGARLGIDMAMTVFDSMKEPGTVL